MRAPFKHLSLADEAGCLASPSQRSSGSRDCNARVPHCGLRHSAATLQIVYSECSLSVYDLRTRSAAPVHIVRTYCRVCPSPGRRSLADCCMLRPGFGSCSPVHVPPPFVVASTTRQREFPLSAARPKQCPRTFNCSYLGLNRFQEALLALLADEVGESPLTLYSKSSELCSRVVRARRRRGLIKSPPTTPPPHPQQGTRR